MPSTLVVKIKTAPKQPGCYLYKDQSGAIIYIGKAKNLRNRIAHYFQDSGNDIKTKKLVSEIDDVEFIVTLSEVEALILEAQLIRKHKPKYNIELKYGVRYAYIKITDEKFPRLVTTRDIKKGDRVFGPYVSGLDRRNLINLANKIFHLRTGKLLTRKSRELGQDEIYIEPGIGRITAAEYQKNIEKVELLLKGKNQELLKKLKAEMKQYAVQNKFELAKLRRDQIYALESLSEKQTVQLQKNYNQDVINYTDSNDSVVLQLFNITKGVISGRKTFTLKKKISEQTELTVAEFIAQYYFQEDIAEELILPRQIPDQDVLAQYLTKLAGRKVTITVPVRGDKIKLLELVKKNIEIMLESGDPRLSELQKVLSLKSLPETIECFDISNLGPRDVVGSMVYFRNGVADKNNYRRFKIKTFVGQSDFDAMKEVVFRRYYRLKHEQSELPDLIIVDGGKPQLKAALTALRALHLEIPLIALAKKEEEIFRPGRSASLRLLHSSPALQLLQRIRNEAHRFAIQYQRMLRKKSDFQ